MNCLHEIFFDAALAQAKQLDDYFAQHKKPMGPLHGLPISLKDQFHVAGVETTMGYVGWIGTFEGRKGTGMEKVFESELVRELRGQGAVLYCKTSVPHSLMTGETINNIIGYTPNPHNRFLAAGGSSGGEGALIALKGSPLGVGSDIGGSIRIPAAFNGLYGLRPSGGRVPYQGVANSMDGQNSILSVLGPLASSARDLKLFLKSVLDTKPWLYDPLVVDLPWRESLAQEVTAPGKKLTFGILRSDAVAAPQPPVARALRLAAEALENAGHSLIDWKPPSHERAIEIIVSSREDSIRGKKGHFADPQSKCRTRFGALTADATSTAHLPSPRSPSHPRSLTCTEKRRNQSAQPRRLPKSTSTSVRTRRNTWTTGTAPLP